MTTRVHHFSGGAMRPFGGRLVDGERGIARRAELTCHCMLVETGSELVLVDTGMGTPALTRPTQWLGRAFAAGVSPVRDASRTAAAQVRALGYEPADVRHIVLTHLDLDHAGGLVDFPHATVHVNARELRTLEQPVDAKERSRYRKVQFAHGPAFTGYEAGGESWFGFDAVRQLTGLPPDILLIPLAGHTNGHAGVAVRTGDEWRLHAGDAYFFHGEVAAEPHCPPGLSLFERAMQTDRTARVANQRRLAELSRSGEVTMFCSHDPVELARLS
ncbi:MULTISPECIES: MBL fold metallo-hydrolase [Prauserella salsuginis group]|uniref:Glyoxylase-like metal-dependent hydrolase (Beta-lactamase superfamily II) n=2 Tax=Prauserella salsuginis group TaxID=2893672 RepID=A0A839XLL0_9PSEU|nr:MULTISPECIES: MBL fold metallo-hydrolase [Prauserella salsuginis group]MBB3663507.1 glyoxylase-like metal-dependent hydrolase (beta-lactamase superfamily II) [Prauserella sediminis]MCR3720673.1 Metallo-beta-lactamase superfamily protein [Prauserella flava]MCR3735246.1 Metallo-beta-lactamase superfamily protein [Prauserella salsuginis]